MNPPFDPSSLAGQLELIRRLPSPRRVRIHGGTRLVKWVYFLAFVLPPIAALSFVAYRTGKAELLRTSGVVAMGRVVASRTVVDDSETRSETTLIDFEYDVAGATYRFQTSRAGAHFIPAGEAEVVYLPARPSVATSRADLDLPVMETGAEFGVFMGLFMGLIGIPFVWFAQRPYRRRRRLLVYGTLAEAVIESVTDGEATIVKYSFQAEGVARSSQVAVESLGAAQLKPGERVPMLYDPGDPRVSDLLMAAYESYGIVGDDPLAPRLAAE